MGWLEFSGIFFLFIKFDISEMGFGVVIYFNRLREMRLQKCSRYLEKSKVNLECIQAKQNL